jgi:predicted HTH transcriptional regulator
MKRKLEKALQVKRESKHVDFKEAFDPDSRGDWCEILKDVVAIANSGGGVIVIGLKNNGTPAESDVSEILKVDQAVFVDKIYSYTDTEFSDIAILELEKGRADGRQFNIWPYMNREPRTKIW